MASISKGGMLAAILALLAALGGCAASATSQVAQPYGHFYSATELSSVSLKPGQHVAVLLGRNAAATLDYLQRHREVPSSVPGASRAVQVATLNSGSQAYGWPSRWRKPSPRSPSTTIWTPCSPIAPT